MHHKILWVTIAILLVLFTLVGCNENNKSGTILSSTPTQESVPGIDVSGSSTTEVMDEGYPGPALEVQTEDSQTGYPVQPTVPQENTQNIPQPSLPLQLNPSELGATVGGIVIDPVKQQAPPESFVYLGTMKYTETQFPVVSLNRQKAPFAILPPNGAFIIEDVAPGEYALVFVTPDYSYLVEDDEEMSVIFTVVEGDVLDLGAFTVSTP